MIARNLKPCYGPAGVDPPSEAQIKAACKRFQKGWTQDDRIKRGEYVVPWSLPVIAMPDVSVGPVISYGEIPPLP